MLHCSQFLPEIISYQIMVCWHSSKKHVNVTTSLKNLLYLCLVFPGYIKHNRKFPCGNSIFQDKTVMYYIHHTMSMWGQYDKSIAACIHHISVKRIQAPGRPPFLTIHHPPTFESSTRPTKNSCSPKIAHGWIPSHWNFFITLACEMRVLYITTN